MRVAVVGSFVVDLMARVSRLPKPGETVRGTIFSSGPGGKGSNQAVAAKRLGCDLLFSTKIGKDAFANIAWEAFRANGLELENIFTSDTEPTGSALIAVDELSGQNYIIVVPGACNSFSAEEIDLLVERLDACEYLLLQLEINLDATAYLVDKVKRKGIKIILNPAPFHKPEEELLRGLYLVTPNETEASSMTGLPCKSSKDCEAIAKRLFEMGVENVVITLGSSGVYVHDGKQGCLIENYPLQVVDTTGAGDAFNGGLLAALSRGEALIAAAEYGNVASNLSVTRMGTTPAMPTKEEVEEFLLENRLKRAQRIVDIGR